MLTYFYSIARGWASGLAGRPHARKWRVEIAVSQIAVARIQKTFGGAWYISTKPYRPRCHPPPICVPKRCLTHKHVLNWAGRRDWIAPRAPASSHEHEREQLQR